MEKILFNNQIIQDKIIKLALKLQHRHRNDPTPMVFVCVLNGGFMFFSDLVKNLHLSKFECDFIRVKSYLGQEQGEIITIKGIENSIENKHVYLIDDIYDSGRTIKYLVDNLSKRNPKSLRVATIIKRKVNIHPIENIDYLFEIDDEWVWGYGMDDENGFNRNLSYIVAK
jgi:hypoxanthine phosphoribosyltransferase